MSIDTRPTPDEMRRVADWLAECNKCGVEHVARDERMYDQREGSYMGRTYAALDGHRYAPRSGVRYQESQVVVRFLRKQADVHV